MRYFVLAADYDGTLARKGRVDQQTVAALQRVRESGRINILVTGRQINDLLNTFPHPELFERIVAENGAVIYNPSSRKETVLGEPPPETLIETLRNQNIPLAVGRVIVATTVPHETSVLRVVRELGLEWQVIFNKGAVMTLPAGVNKALGLQTALSELGFSPHAVIGIGDAENDHAFLESCACSVAVSNALPSLKERADLVTQHDHGAGVTELIEKLVATDLIELAEKLQRHDIELGFRDGPAPVRIPAYGSSILVAGTSGGGKSTLTTGFMERLREKKYQFCIVDPEGDYSDIDLPVLGDKAHAPNPSEIMGVLMQPDQNIVINLTGITLEQRPAFFTGLLPHFQEFRARTGRPHWFFIDEAHHLLPETRDSSSWIPQSLHGIWMVTVHPEHVSRSVLLTVNTVVAIGNRPKETIASFGRKLGVNSPDIPQRELEAGEAIVWDRNSGQNPFRIRSISPRSERQRHKRKYAEGELPPDQSFYFRGPEGRLNLRAQNMQLFIQVSDGVDDETWLHHLSRGDYSDWLENLIKDPELAAAVSRVERNRALSAKESRTAIRELIEERYTAPE